MFPFRHYVQRVSNASYHRRVLHVDDINIDVIIVGVARAIVALLEQTRHASRHALCVLLGGSALLCSGNCRPSSARVMILTLVLNEAIY